MLPNFRLVWGLWCILCHSTHSFQSWPTFVCPLNISHFWPLAGISFLKLLAWLDLLTLRPLVSHFLSGAFLVHLIYVSTLSFCCIIVPSLHFPGQCFMARIHLLLIIISKSVLLTIPSVRLDACTQWCLLNSCSIGQTLGDLTQVHRREAGNKIQILMCLTPKAQLSAMAVLLAQRAWS